MFRHVSVPFIKKRGGRRRAALSLLSVSMTTPFRYGPNGVRGTSRPASLGHWLVKSVFISISSCKGGGNLSTLNRPAVCGHCRAPPYTVNIYICSFLRLSIASLGYPALRCRRLILAIAKLPDDPAPHESVLLGLGVPPLRDQEFPFLSVRIGTLPRPARILGG